MGRHEQRGHLPGEGHVATGEKANWWVGDFPPNVCGGGGYFFQVNGGLSKKFLVGGKMFFAARSQILLFALLFVYCLLPLRS